MRLTRRQMLGLLATLGLRAAIPGVAAAHCKPTVIPWRNWSGAQNCIPSHRIAPGDEDELAALLRDTRDATIRPVGSGHSFSGLVPTDGKLVSLARFEGLVSADPGAKRAEFYAGTLLSQTGKPLKEAGLALENMPDIDYQSLGGLLATSTHGTGIGHGSMSTQIEGLTLVTANGEVLECSRDSNTDLFNAACVSLGALGVVTRVKLRCRDAFRIRERMWIAKTDDLLDDIDRHLAENQHFEMQIITHSDFALAITLNETEEAATGSGDEDDEGGNEYVKLIEKLDKYGSDFPRARRALLNLMSRAASFEDRIADSYAIFANVRNVRFNEMEYQVAAEDGPTCVREILKLIRDKDLQTWFPIEYRYVRGDDIWLSQFQGQTSASISVHQYYKMDHHNFFAAVEPVFWRYGARPHWGKLHTLNARLLSKLYPHWNDFHAVRAQTDPDGKFLNAHLQTTLGVRPKWPAKLS